MNQDDQSDHELRAYWDKAAISFDDEPDHGLQDPQVRQAWIELLEKWLSPPRAAILDVGCGTGSLGLIMAGLGHHVTAIDVSPAMIAAAKAKAAAWGYSIKFHLTNAAAPPFSPGSFDVIVCRHLLWTFPDPATLLRHWVGLLKPTGRLILIEGYWNTGAGKHAAEIVAALPESVTPTAVQDLSDQSIYWGRPVTDERYLIIADLHP